ncbi:hypothetical protein 2017DRC87_1000 [Vibrio phage ICP1]|nr:hypothetical protein 2017DRC87_1000 [Vibrio phage ICP1]
MAGLSNYTAEVITQTIASVTEHLVHEIAHSEPNKFIDENGCILLWEVLHYLGFHVGKVEKDITRSDRTTLPDGYFMTKNVIFEPQQIVRDLNNPHMTYKCGVYKGKLRQIPTGRVSGKRKITTPHKMQGLYDKYGTLQAKDIYKYVPKYTMVNILEVGNDYDLKSSKECD